MPGLTRVSNLVGEQIGARSYLYCSPGDLLACTAELKPDLEAIIAAAEVWHCYLHDGRASTTRLTRLDLPAETRLRVPLAAVQPCHPAQVVPPRRHGEPRLQLLQRHDHLGRPREHIRRRARVCAQLQREPGDQCLVGALLAQRGLDRVPGEAHPPGAARAGRQDLPVHRRLAGTPVRDRVVRRRQ